MRADLDDNERWYLRARFVVSPRGRVVKLATTSPVQDCAACFHWAAPGRAARARRSARTLPACIERVLRHARFGAAEGACEEDLGWSLGNNW